MLDAPSTFDIALPLISGVVAVDGSLTDIWPAGTAFVPLPGVVITCWHCVRNGDRSYAVLWPSVGGRPERIVRLVDITPDPRGRDLAMGRARLRPRFPFTFSATEPQGFAEVLTVGFPLPDRTRDTSGRIVIETTARTLRGYGVRVFDNERHVGFAPQPSYELDMPAPGGLSGAPLLVQGEGAISLVGVVYGSADTYAIAEESHVDPATGTASLEVRRHVSFALAHRLDALRELAGEATDGTPLGNLIPSM